MTKWIQLIQSYRPVKLSGRNHSVCFVFFFIVEFLQTHKTSVYNPPLSNFIPFPFRMAFRSDRSHYLNSIEATAEPVQGPESEHWVHARGPRLFASDPTIRSSASAEQSDEADRQRLGFHNLLGLKLALKKRIKYITIVTTVFVTITSTSVDYITVSTKTFFVQICTPSPFPFDVCVRSRR